ncbi:MAG: hypothetical protein SGCHY_001636 [Lobulomycetales sp.]
MRTRSSYSVKLLLLFAAFYVVYVQFSNSEVERSKKRLKLEEPAKEVAASKGKKIPLCFVTSWEGSELPTYAKVSLESLSRGHNSEFAKLFLFHHNSKNSVPVPEAFPAVEFVDLASIDSGYRDGGFPAFLADRLCNIFYPGERGQMTGHILKRNPNLVNNVWRKCEDLRSLKDIYNSFSMQKTFIDEGCYAKAIIKSNADFVQLPWYESSYLPV